MEYHSSIAHFRIGRSFITSRLFNDMRIFGQHILMGNPHITEENETVVKSIQSKFWTYVANCNSRQRLMRLEIPDGYDKRMRAMAFPIQDQLSHDTSMIGPERSRNANRRKYVRPSDPIHHFDAVKTGELIMNSWVDLSYVAVVSKP
jgi:hypothetical protein